MAFRFGPNYTERFKQISEDMHREKTLGIAEFEFITKEWQEKLDKNVMRNFVLALLFVTLGLWAISESYYVTAAILLIVARAFEKDESNNGLFAGMLWSQKLLAMMINKQSEEINDLKLKVQSRFQA